MTPASRCLKRLRRCESIADIAGRCIPRGNIRGDPFGGIDLVAVHPRASGVLGIQATTANPAAPPLRKTRMVLALVAWLTAPFVAWNIFYAFFA